MRHIYLVRHGEMDVGTDEKLCVGKTDMPLAEGAYERAVTLGKWLRKNIDGDPVIASSQLARAFDTALAIAECFGTNAGGVAVDEGFSEVDTGAWGGKSFSVIRREYPDDYEDHGKSLGYYRFPDGESVAESGARFERALKRLMKTTNGDIIVVSHSGPIRAMLCRMLGMSADDFMKLPAPTLGVTIISEDGKLAVERVGYRPTALLDTEEINTLYRKNNLPDNVVSHMKKVAEYSRKILNETDPKCERFDHELVTKAALVHDVARLQPNHAICGARILRREGFYDVADLVEAHHGIQINEDGPLTEEEILFYADKRVLEDKVVTLEERFTESRKKCRTDEAKRNHAALHRKAELIETKMFGGKQDETR